MTSEVAHGRFGASCGNGPYHLSKHWQGGGPAGFFLCKSFSCDLTAFTFRCPLCRVAPSLYVISYPQIVVAATADL